jgi:hypothetical protein
MPLTRNIYIPCQSHICSSDMPSQKSFTHYPCKKVDTANAQYTGIQDTQDKVTTSNMARMTPDNEWTTVGARRAAPAVEIGPAATRTWASASASASSAPATRTWTSAAGAGQRDRRREEAEWTAHQAREKQAAEEKARKEAAAKLNFSSEKEYPSLGAKKVAPLPKKTALNFAATAAAAAALPAPEPAVDDFRNPEAMARRSRIGNRCWDDGPLDYDGPEEDEMPPYEDDDEENPDAEYNAGIVSDRRRGDNGVW